MEGQEDQALSEESDDMMIGVLLYSVPDLYFMSPLGHFTLHSDPRVYSTKFLTSAIVRLSMLQDTLLYFSYHLMHFTTTTR